MKLSELKKCMNCKEETELKIDWITGYNSSKIALCKNCWEVIREIEKKSPKQAETLRMLWQSYISRGELQNYM